MCGGEGVVDEDIGERCEFFREAWVVLFLGRVVAGVFQDQHVAVCHGADGLLRHRSDAIVGEIDLTTQYLAERGCHGGEGHFRYALAFGSIEMAAYDDFRAFAR